MFGQHPQKGGHGPSGEGEDAQLALACSGPGPWGPSDTWASSWAPARKCGPRADWPSAAPCPGILGTRRQTRGPPPRRRGRWPASREKAASGVAAPRWAAEGLACDLPTVQEKWAERRGGRGRCFRWGVSRRPPHQGAALSGGDPQMHRGAGCGARLGSDLDELVVMGAGGDMAAEV